MMLYSTDLLLDKNKPEQIKQPKLPCIFLWIRGWIPCFNLKLSEFDFWRASRIVDCVCWFIICGKIWVCFFLSIAKHFFISFSHSYQKKKSISALSMLMFVLFLAIFWSQQMFHVLSTLPSILKHMLQTTKKHCYKVEWKWYEIGFVLTQYYQSRIC